MEILNIWVFMWQYFFMKLFRQILLSASLMFLSVNGIAQKNQVDSTEFFNADNFVVCISGGTNRQVRNQPIGLK